jgi:TPP-dependent pyruvate/acetoin dehydrogenase alpha subunit
MEAKLPGRGTAQPPLIPYFSRSSDRAMALIAPKKPTSTAPHLPDQQTLLRAWELMCTAKAMTELYEEHFKLTSKYVHATSRGHEAIQLALGLQLKPQDFVAPYYRDDSILLGIGM